MRLSHELRWRRVNWPSSASLPDSSSRPWPAPLPVPVCSSPWPGLPAASGLIPGWGRLRSPASAGQTCAIFRRSSSRPCLPPPSEHRPRPRSRGGWRSDPPPSVACLTSGSLWSPSLPSCGCLPRSLHSRRSFAPFPSEKNESGSQCKQFKSSISNL